MREAAEAAGALAAEVTGIVAVVGIPASGAEAALHNAAVVLADGRIAATYHKHHLPNYAVFDERRYFAPGRQALVIEVRGWRVGLTICEDIWIPGGPADWAAAEGGADLLANLSASPYHREKGRERENLFAARCRRQRCGLAFCNAVGGQDELVFDGHSLVIGPDGAVIARGKQFEEEMLVVDLERPAGSRNAAPEPAGDGQVTTVSLTAPAAPAPRPPLPSPQTAALLSPAAETYRALTLGTADYIRKNRFRGAVLGLSGGIDSALTLAMPPTRSARKR